MASKCDLSRVWGRRCGGGVSMLRLGSLGVLLPSGVLLGWRQPQWLFNPP